MPTIIRNAPNPQGIRKGSVVSWTSNVNGKDYSGVVLDVIDGDGPHYIGVTVRQPNGCVVNVPCQFLQLEVA